MILLLLAAQASAATAPTSFSILQPVGSEPCVRRGKDKTAPDDIVVCGQPLPSQKLPYPAEVVPKGPQPSNPYLTGTGAMAVESGAPCAAVQSGCTSGIDLIGGSVKVVRLLQKAVSPGSCCEEPGEASNPVLLLKDAAHGVGRVFRKKPDTSNRVAIDLDAPSLSAEGRVKP